MAAMLAETPLGACGAVLILVTGWISATRHPAMPHQGRSVPDRSSLGLW